MGENRMFKGLLFFLLSLTIIVLYILFTNSRIVNEETLSIGFVILVFGIVALGAAYSTWTNKKRREAIEQIAPEMGFNYLRDDKTFTLQLEAQGKFDLFKKGRSRKASNILRSKRRDFEVTLFDHQYTTGSGRSSQTHHQTVALFSLENAQLPQFILRPRNLLDHVAAKFKRMEIDFSHRLDFSKKYLLRGSDETAIKRVINDPVLTFFEQQEKLSSEADGNQLLIYRSGHRVKPEELPAFLDKSTQALELMRRPTLSIDFYDFTPPRS